MSEHYILKDEVVIPVDLMTWARWFENTDRTIEKTKVNNVEVSTVFLGLDHNYSKIGAPLLFETMIFGDEKYEQYQERYSTIDEARKGHIEAIEFVRKGENNND